MMGKERCLPDQFETPRGSFLVHFKPAACSPPVRSRVERPRLVVAVIKVLYVNEMKCQVVNFKRRQLVNALSKIRRRWI